MVIRLRRPALDRGCGAVITGTRTRRGRRHADVTIVSHAHSDSDRRQQGDEHGEYERPVAGEQGGERADHRAEYSAVRPANRGGR